MLGCIASEYGGAMREIIAMYRERGQRVFFTIGWDDGEGTYPQVFTELDCSVSEGEFARAAARAALDYAEREGRDTSGMLGTLYIDCND